MFLWKVSIRFDTDQVDLEILVDSILYLHLTVSRGLLVPISRVHKVVAGNPPWTGFQSVTHTQGQILELWEEIGGPRGKPMKI